MFPPRAPRSYVQFVKRLQLYDVVCAAPKALMGTLLVEKRTASLFIWVEHLSCFDDDGGMDPLISLGTPGGGGAFDQHHRAYAFTTLLCMFASAHDETRPIVLS